MKKFKLLTGLTVALMFGGVASLPAIAQPAGTGSGPTPGDTQSPATRPAGPTNEPGQRFDPVQDRDREGQLIEQERRQQEGQFQQQQPGQFQQQPGQFQQQPGQLQQQPGQFQQQPGQFQQQPGQFQQQPGQFQQQQFPESGQFDDDQAAPIRALW